MIQRRHPLKRSTKPLKRTPLKRKFYRIPRISERRRKQRAEYAPGRLAYLQAHPFCQIWIARHGFDEARVIADDGWTPEGRAPAADQIHHRNKGYGARLTDQRWWMSACLREHEWVEGAKDQARALGFLLPMEADANGRSPGGAQALETPAFMAARIGHVTP